MFFIAFGVGSKYLGFYLDECLTFNKYVHHLHKKSSQSVGVIRRARKFLDQPTTLILYKSLASPNFDYGNIIYSVTSKANLNCFQIVQNRELMSGIMLFATEDQ